jgi:hypothetical protein
MRQALGHASPKAAAGSGRPGQCKARHHMPGFKAIARVKGI